MVNNSHIYIYDVLLTPLQTDKQPIFFHMTLLTVEGIYQSTTIFSTKYNFTYKNPPTKTAYSSRIILYWCDHGWYLSKSTMKFCLWFSFNRWRDCGIYSFARLDPLFPHSSTETLQKPCTEEELILILKRAVSTYVHEIMHLFGLEHCIYYLCLMNGANCENEMDGQLLYICPICLRKMYSLFGKQYYKIRQMYHGLLEL
jgi:hypothetical protein